MAIKRMTEIKEFDIVSVGIVLGFVEAVLFFIMVLLMIPFTLFATSMHSAMGPASGLLFFGGIAGLIIAPIIGFIIGFIVGIVCAFIYNIIAGKVGGVKIRTS